MRTPLPIWIAAVGLSVAATSSAAAQTGSGNALVADLVVGPAFLGQSESHAIGHAFKPAARLGVRAALSSRWELGGALSGIVDDSAHYRVVGALAQGRFALWQVPVISLGAALALGVGHDADVLNDGLRGSGGLLGYGFAALDARWTIAARWLVGAEAAWENLSIARVGLLVGVRAAVIGAARLRGLIGLASLLALLAGCGAPLPDGVAGYETRCLRMNAQAIPPYDGDPHRGMKNVYACNVPPADVEANRRPFPDGALIVKESTRVGEDFVWLVALARKQGGVWQWDEYTRNFADEELRHGLAGRSVCTGCHVHADDADWIFTAYARD